MIEFNMTAKTRSCLNAVRRVIYADTTDDSNGSV